MEDSKKRGGFWICMLLSLIVNFQGIIPGTILLLCYLILGIPGWISLIAFGMWVLNILLWVLITGWAVKCSTVKNTSINKNPYSVKMKESAVA